jgi:hypothetical protein
MEKIYKITQQNQVKHIENNKKPKEIGTVNAVLLENDKSMARLLQNVKCKCRTKCPLTGVQVL